MHRFWNQCNILRKVSSTYHTNVGTPAINVIYSEKYQVLVAQIKSTKKITETKNESDKKWMRPKMKATKIENDQKWKRPNSRRPKIMTTKAKTTKKMRLAMRMGREVHLRAAVWAPPIGRRRLGAWQLGAVLFVHRTFGHRFPMYLYFSSYEEKTMKQAILWMPLSANLFRLESSNLTPAKRAANRNNVATENRN